MKLLIIRPQPGADATAQRAAALGIATLVIPLFEVRPVAWTVPANQAYDALMITSANVLLHGGAELLLLQDLPVLAVGATTAAHANAAGFSVSATGDGGAAELIEAAAAKGFKQLLWLTGADHIALDPPASFHVDRIPVYGAHALPPPHALTAALNSPAMTALHSPRAARLFSQICGDLGIDKSRQSLAALSPAIANAAGPGWRAIAVAERPTDAALLSAAEHFCG